MLFDSHAHINENSYSTKERDKLIKIIESSNVEYVADIGYDLASSKLAVKHAAKYPWCYAVVGCHPHETKSMNDMKLAVYKDLVRKKKVVAIGEIGLDFHYDRSPREIQMEWFCRQIRLANELKMSIVVHSREADRETMEILKKEGAFSEERKSWFPKRLNLSECTWENGDDAKKSADISVDFGIADARVLIHCFSGNAELAMQYIKLGATISVAGSVTYKNNRKTMAAVAEVPIDFILVETDSPYLSPEPMRGRRNLPPNVEYTVKKVAEIKGMAFEDVAAKTKENAMRFYGIL